MRNLIVLVITCVASACARPNYVQIWPERFALSGGPQLGYAIKRVVEKESPATLIGDDGSVCRTSKKRFADTKAGRWIACLWSLPSLDSTHLAGRLSRPSRRL